MKYLGLTILAFAFTLPAKAQFVRPIESESMYKQLRSMEDGPWKFAPEPYYYSWYKKTIKMPWPIPDFKITMPGFGIHDRGFAGTGFLGDGYVKKYAPSGKLRAQMIAHAEITRKQYEAIEKKYQEIGEREALDAADRKIDLALRLYYMQFETMYQNIQTLCQVYERHTRPGAGKGYLDEMERIKSNIEYIGKSYSRNAERSKAYLKELDNLERLSVHIKTATKRAYAQNYASKISI